MRVSESPPVDFNCFDIVGGSGGDFTNLSGIAFGWTIACANADPIGRLAVEMAKASLEIMDRQSRVMFGSVRFSLIRSYLIHVKKDVCQHASKIQMNFLNYARLSYCLFCGDFRLVRTAFVAAEEYLIFVEEPSRVPADQFRFLGGQLLREKFMVTTKPLSGQEGMRTAFQLRSARALDKPQRRAEVFGAGSRLSYLFLPLRNRSGDVGRRALAPDRWIGASFILKAEKYSRIASQRP